MELKHQQEEQQATRREMEFKHQQEQQKLNLQYQQRQYELELERQQITMTIQNTVGERMEYKGDMQQVMNMVGTAQFQRAATRRLEPPSRFQPYLEPYYDTVSSDEWEDDDGY